MLFLTPNQQCRSTEHSSPKKHYQFFSPELVAHEKQKKSFKKQINCKIMSCWRSALQSGNSNYCATSKWPKQQPDMSRYSQQSVSWLSGESVSHWVPSLHPCASLSASFPVSYTHTSCQWLGPGKHTPHQSLLCQGLGTCGTCTWSLVGCWQQQTHIG